LKNNLTFTTNSGTCVLIIWRNLLAFLVIFFVTLGSSTFGYSYGMSKICLLDVFIVHLLGDGPPFDFSILCPRSFYAPFWHCLLYWGFSNNPLRDLNIHTWTWMCSQLIRDFSKAIFASISTQVLKFNWIEEASLFSICCFNSFDSWALTKLGNTGICMGYLFLGQHDHPDIL
jgi:hypothetical protein